MDGEGVVPGEFVVLPRRVGAVGGPVQAALFPFVAADPLPGQHEHDDCGQHQMCAEIRARVHALAAALAPPS